MQNPNGPCSCISKGKRPSPTIMDPTGCGRCGGRISRDSMRTRECSSIEVSNRVPKKAVNATKKGSGLFTKE